MKKFGTKDINTTQLLLLLLLQPGMIEVCHLSFGRLHNLEQHLTMHRFCNMILHWNWWPHECNCGCGDSLNHNLYATWWKVDLHIRCIDQRAQLSSSRENTKMLVHSRLAQPLVHNECAGMCLKMSWTLFVVYIVCVCVKKFQKNLEKKCRDFVMCVLTFASSYEKFETKDINTTSLLLLLL